MTDRKFPIAIVGFSLRLPGDLDSEQALWEALSGEQNLVSKVNDERWDTRKYYNARKDEKGTSYTFSAGMLSRIDKFDAHFFGVSPREAMDMDPQHRMLLELTWEALENGAQNPRNLEGSNCAVYVGISGNEYSYGAINDTASMGPYGMTGSTNSIASNRISYTFDFHGPSMSIDTACSSSLVALHQACTALWQGEADAAVAGGTNMLIHPMAFVGFSKASMLSPEGLCRSFDNNGQGYVRAEGGMVIYLKPLAQAEADGDPVHAVIANTGVNSDGQTSLLPLPGQQGQADLLHRIYNEAGISPRQLAYIEAHGTGTPVGDPIEVGAISEVLARRRKNGPLPIGSIKSNIGHLEAAAGLAGLLKAVLCLKKKQIPATIHLEKRNENIDFEQANVQVVDRLTDLPAQNKAMIMGINSFGFGGTNAHAIIKEYRPARNKGLQKAPANQAPAPLVISAVHKNSLYGNAGQIANYLTAHRERYYDMAAMLARHRCIHKQVLVVKPETVSQAAEALNEYAQSGECGPVAVETTRIGESEKVGLVYSGNGAQWPGMGKALYQQNAAFKADIDEIAALFHQFDNTFDLVSVLFNEAQDSYDSTAVAQPALFALQVAMTRYLLRQGLEYAAVIGHSVGEIAAAWACGALGLSQAVKVIYYRSQAQERTRGNGRMSAVSVSYDQARSLINALSLNGKVEIAGVNGPEAVTLTGPLEGLTRIGEYCEQQGYFFKLLGLDYSFHSREMNPIKNEILETLADLTPQPASVTYISTVTGKPLAGNRLDAQYWWKNIRKPVLFHQGVEYLVNNGFKLFMDVGPHPIMSYYLRESLKKAETEGVVVPALKRDAWQFTDLQKALLKIIGAGGTYAWQTHFPQPCNKLRLPAYAWNKESFWAPAMAHTSEDMSAHRLHSEHPLLGWRIKQGELAWENHFDVGKSFYIADHVVGEAVVMPAAGFAEMALACARQWGVGDQIEIEDIEIRAPLVIEETASQHVRVDLNPDDGNFIIQSKPRLTDSELTLHAVGRILAKPYAAISFSRPEADLERLTDLTTVSAAEHYRMAEHIGLAYGDHFRAIEAVHISGNRALAELALPREIYDSIPVHVMHPVVLDMCFQSLIPMIYLQNQAAGSDNSCAFLPISMGRIKLCQESMHTRPPARVLTRIRSYSARSVQADFMVLDTDNRPVAAISSCRFKKAALRHEARDPGRYEFTPLALETFSPTDYLAGCVKQAGLDTRCQDDKAAEAATLMEVLITQTVYEHFKGLYPHSPFTLQEATIAQNSLPFARWCLGVLEANGYLYREGETWHWEAVDNSEQPDSTAIWRMIMGDYPEQLPALVLCGQIGMYLPALLAGQTTLEQVIDFNGNLYEQFRQYSASAEFARHNVKAVLNTALAQRPGSQRLRILEIGNGLFCEQILGMLDNHAGAYTLLGDVEKAPVSVAESKNATFCRFDPAMALDEHQPLQNKNFDIVVVSDLDATPALTTQLDRLCQLLAPCGLLLASSAAADGIHHMLYGLNPEWWSFTDLDGKEYPCALPPEQLGDMLKQHGLEVLQHINEFDDSATGAYMVAATRRNSVDNPLPRQQQATLATTLVLAEDPQDPLPEQLSGARVQSLSQWLAALTSNQQYPDDPAAYHRVMIVPADNGQADSRKLTCHFQTLKSLLPRLANNTELILLTRGGALCNDTPELSFPRNPCHAGLWGLFRVLINEYVHLSIRLIDVIGPLQQTLPAVIAVINQPPDGEDELLINAEACYGLRLTAYKGNQASADADARRRPLKLDFHQPGSFKYLEWFEISPAPLGEQEVRVRPLASGLNFRDVMYSLGFVSDEAVENGFLGATLGMEMAGEVIECGSRVSRFTPGDKVMGFASGAFGEQVQTREDTLAALPEGWRYAEGASIATPFFTAYYSLAYLIRLRAGERILIHGAAGGVGIAAIQLASYFGAEIHATAGSPEKRDFLRLMGVRHIYDSRSYAFVEEILAVTDNQGVDVILNSLAGEAINANFRVLKPFGRFLELGKRDFYENSKIGLKPFRNNLSYYGIDVDQLMVEHPGITAELFSELMALFNDGTLKPLPFQCFEADNIQGAFRYMQQSRQIGKIIVDFTNGVNPRHIANIEQPRQHLELDPQASYLVIGGTTGFGFKTAAFLVDKGARHLVLASRGGRINPDSKAELESLKRACPELDISVEAADVADYGQVDALLQRIRNHKHPLKGIIHAATLYEDAMIETMSAGQFDKVIRPKVDGLAHLDQLTRRDDLDFFIAFSSVTTHFGNMGQANYVSANAYMESLIRARRQSGLPGLYVAWGPIDDAGHLTRNTDVKKTLEHTTGSQAITTATAMKILETLIQARTQGITVMDFNVNALSKVMAIFQANKYALLDRDQRAESGDANALVAEILEQDPEDAIAMIAAKIQKEIAAILCVANDDVAINASLPDIGIDSLMGAEFAVSIEKSFGISIPAMSLLQSASIQSLAEMVYARLQGEEDDQAEQAINATLKQHGEEVDA